MEGEKAQKDFREESVKPAIEFIKSLGEKSRIVIAQGHDNDSIFSAVILSKLLTRLGHTVVNFVTEFNFNMTKDDAGVVMKENPDAVIIVDIAEVGQDVIDVLSETKTLVVDHHEEKPYNFPYVNPRKIISTAYVPTSYLAYKIFSGLADPKEILWLAGVGVLADHGVKQNVDLFQKLKEVEPELVGNSALEDEALFDNSKMGELASIFDSSRIVVGKAGVYTAIKVLLEAGSYRDIKEDGSSDLKQLFYWHKEVEKEFKSLIDGFEKEQKKIGKNIVVFEVKSELGLKSRVAGYLQRRCGKNVLVVLQKTGYHYEASFRRGEGVEENLRELAKRSVKDIPDSTGGGHEAASAARFPEAYLAGFLQNLE